MNARPPGFDPTTLPTIDDEYRARRSRALPTWPWLLLIVVLLVVLAILATLLVVGDSGKMTAPPSSNALSTALPTPSATGDAATPSSAPAPPPPPAQDDITEGPFDPGMKAKIADILNSQNTAVFAQSGLFHDPVEVHVIGGEDNVMTPDEATMAISFMFTPSDPYAWDLDLPDKYLNAYRVHYPELFPTWAIVAKSHDKAVFSFLGHGSIITTVVVVASEGALG